MNNEDNTRGMSNIPRRPFPAKHQDTRASSANNNSYNSSYNNSYSNNNPNQGYNSHSQGGYNSNSQGFNNNRGQQQRPRVDRFKKEGVNYTERLVKQNDIMIRLLKEIRDRLPAPPVTEQTSATGENDHSETNQQNRPHSAEQNNQAQDSNQDGCANESDDNYDENEGDGQPEAFNEENDQTT